MQRLGFADRRPALAGLAAFALVAALVRPADYAKPISWDRSGSSATRRSHS
jgi:hypothetical protein